MITIHKEITDLFYKKFVVGKSKKEQELQLDILQEQCSKLIQEISEVRRALVDQELHPCPIFILDVSSITEGLAEVMMSINQVATYFGITQHNIDKEIWKKLEKYNLDWPEKTPDPKEDIIPKEKVKKVLDRIALENCWDKNYHHKSRCGSYCPFSETTGECLLRKLRLSLGLKPLPQDFSAAIVATDYMEITNTVDVKRIVERPDANGKA